MKNNGKKITKWLLIVIGVLFTVYVVYVLMGTFGLNSSKNILKKISIAAAEKLYNEKFQFSETYKEPKCVEDFFNKCRNVVILKNKSTNENLEMFISGHSLSYYITVDNIGYTVKLKEGYMSPFKSDIIESIKVFE